MGVGFTWRIKHIILLIVFIRWITEIRTIQTLWFKIWNWKWNVCLIHWDSLRFKCFIDHHHCVCTPQPLTYFRIWRIPWCTGLSSFTASTCVTSPSTGKSNIFWIVAAIASFKKDFMFAHRNILFCKQTKHITQYAMSKIDRYKHIIISSEPSETFNNFSDTFGAIDATTHAETWPAHEYWMVGGWAT